MPTDNSYQTDEPFWVIGIYRMEKQTEIWKDIPNYEGCYQVSNLGRLKSLDRVFVRSNGKKQTIKGRVLKLRKGLYYSIKLRNKNKENTHYVHHIVMESFREYKVKKGYHIDHIDSDKYNNRLDNLRVLTHSENIKRGMKKK